MAEEILDEARRTFRSDHGSDPWSQRAWAEVRYAGQSHELSVSLVPDWAQLRQEFEDVHQARFGFTRAGEAIELVDVRRSHRSFPDHMGRHSSNQESGTPGPPRRARDLAYPGSLCPGTRDRGPGSVIEQDSAVWLSPRPDVGSRGRDTGRGVMKGSVEEARRFATAALVAVAEPEKSEGMQAYMKTDMPSTGCRSLPGRALFAKLPGTSLRRTQQATSGWCSVSGTFPTGRSIWRSARPTLRGVCDA